jgi:hypothetical protein
LACATHQYTLLNTDSGWIKLSKPPIEAKNILTVADRRVQEQYASDEYDYVWFSRDHNEYLIYFHDHYWTEDYNYASSHCGDETVIFKKTSSGWIQTKDGKSVICVD